MERRRPPRPVSSARRARTVAARKPRAIASMTGSHSIFRGNRPTDGVLLGHESGRRKAITGLDPDADFGWSPGWTRRAATGQPAETVPGSAGRREPQPAT